MLRRENAADTSSYRATLSESRHLKIPNKKAGLARQAFEGFELGIGGPWLSTFLINLLGSFLAGGLYGVSISGRIAPSVLKALAVGFLGGFTTFSAFSIDSVKLLEAGRVLAFFINWAGQPFFINWAGQPFFGVLFAGLGFFWVDGWGVRPCCSCQRIDQAVYEPFKRPLDPLVLC